MSLAPGARIADRYQLERLIAVGGMGEVWEAADVRLGRSVAIKVLKAELSHDGEFLQRFRVEAQTVASLSHVGIASVHDYGEDDGSGTRIAYLVMELVRGEPLSARLAATGRIDAEQTLSLLEQTGHALQAAHERGFVHRDVKPGNILITEDGLVKITDFGIAKAANSVPMTASGMVMGTAHYIAPEQAMGGEAGPAGDVYSLGIVGYECLAGRRPFQADNPVNVAMMQIRDAPPPLPADVPPPVRALIETALVKDPAERYANGAELAMAAAAVRRGLPLPRPGVLRSPVRAEPRRAPAPASSGGGRRGPARAPNRPGHPAPAPAVAAAPPLAVAARHVPAAVKAPPAAVTASPATPSPALVTGQHRLPGRSRAGRSILLSLFVLLTASALVLGAFVVRDAVNKIEASPSTAAGIPPPAQTSASRSAGSKPPAGSVDVDQSLYVGRSATVVRVELKAQALRPTVVSTRGAPPLNEAGCTVTAISPAGIVKINTAVTVTCTEAGR